MIAFENVQMISESMSFISFIVGVIVEINIVSLGITVIAL